MAASGKFSRGIDDWRYLARQGPRDSCRPLSDARPARLRSFKTSEADVRAVGRIGSSNFRFAVIRWGVYEAEMADRARHPVTVTEQLLVVACTVMDCALPNSGNPHPERRLRTQKVDRRRIQLWR